MRPKRQIQTVQEEQDQGSEHRCLLLLLWMGTPTPCHAMPCHVHIPTVVDDDGDDGVSKRNGLAFVSQVCCLLLERLAQ